MSIVSILTFAWWLTTRKTTETRDISETTGEEQFVWNRSKLSFSCGSRKSSHSSKYRNNFIYAFYRLHSEEMQEGNVFTAVCPSTEGWGVSLSHVLSLVSCPRSFLGGNPSHLFFHWSLVPGFFLGGTPVSGCISGLWSQILFRGTSIPAMGIPVPGSVYCGIPPPRWDWVTS